MNMNQYIQMLRMVSRTFTLSIEQLPKDIRGAVTLAYLLFRVSDCLEDHATMEATRKIELLQLWSKILEGQHSAQELTRKITDLDSSDPEVYVAQQADQLLAYLHTMPPQVRDSIIARVNETTLGMARWQAQGPHINTEEEMDDYMHQVAGLVGYLLTDIFAWHSRHINARKENLIPLSREFGLALQTVNVIRGIRKDYERGWIFVPHTFLAQAGITAEQLFVPEFQEKALHVVKLLTDKAERHLTNGLEYIQMLPRTQHRIRLFCVWPLFFAVKTLAISRDNTNVLLDEAKMSRDQVKAIIRDTTLMGWSNRWLNRYYTSLNSPTI
jgi:farnesyl-diphosphate farnesyltransferase